MKDENVHDFFHNVSRLTIILPIIIIGVAIVLKPRTTAVPRIKSVTYTTSPTLTPNVTDINSKNRISINLQGPFICTVKDDSEYQGLVYIKNKQVRADFNSADNNSSISAVLHGDCLYKWKNGGVTGAKMCGLSQYVSILDTMANFGALDAQTLMSMVTQFGSANGSKNIPKNAPETVCKKDQFTDTVFDVPKTIQFQVVTATPSAVNK